MRFNFKCYYLVLFLSSSLFFSSECWPKELPENVKRAVQKVSNSTKSLQISEFSYEGKSFYWVPPGQCCDLFDTLIDGQGKVVCHPAGGIAGRGDGKCPDYVQKLKKLRVHVFKSDDSQ
jgi:hypothetical protein